MKKSVLLLAAAFGVSGAFAQDLTSKKGEPFLPEAGDWAIGIEATPFLNYAGQMLSNAGATAPNFNYLTNNQTIIGKMFKDEKTAYRAGIRLGFGSNTTRNMVSDRITPAPTNTFPTVQAQKENSWKHSQNGIGLTGGIEMRRGKTRLQGFYGGELGLFVGGSKDVFTYGNALKVDATNGNVNVDGTDDAFTGSSNITTDTYGNTARITERKNGSTFSFGLRGFIGAEYFIFPKMSIGGEFGWGLGMTSQGKTTTTTESIGTITSGQVTGTQTIEGAKSGSFSLDTDGLNSVFGPAAQLRLNLHF